MNGNSGQNEISGTSSSETLTGTSGIDVINALEGDDVLDGGAGADILDGGAGSDRYILADDAIDTLYFRSDTDQQDVLDISNLVPDSVNSNNLSSYLKVNDKGVFLDSGGQGQFSTENQIARFVANNPPFDALIAVQVADTSVIQFDWTQTADIPLADAPSGTTEPGAENNQVNGTSADETLTGTSGADTLNAQAGDDVLNGGAGADVYKGGEGNDRHVLANTDAVDTLYFRTDTVEQDILDISVLLPNTGVTSNNLQNYLKVTTDAVYLDAEGKGTFAEEDKIAEFAENNPRIEDTIRVQVAENTVFDFDWTETASIPLVASATNEIPDTDSYKKESPQTINQGFPDSSEGQSVQLGLDEQNRHEAFGGDGNGKLDSSNLEAGQDFDVKRYGGDGADTLTGNANHTYLDGGKGNDRLEAGGGWNFLSGGSGDDEFALTLEVNNDYGIHPDLLYDFTSNDDERDVLDLQAVLPAEANSENLHSYLKVTETGVFVDLTGNGHFKAENQLARFGEIADIDNLVNVKLSDGTVIQFNRDEALNIVEGGTGKDILEGGEGSDILRGNAGDDVLDGDSLAKTKSADYLFGGEGNDTIHADRLDFTDGTVDGGAGFDRVKINGDAEENINVDLYASNIEHADGGSSNDVLDGSGFTDTRGGYNKDTGEYEAAEAQRLELYGRKGNDTLVGGVGRDYLDGGSGVDTLSGGLGKDFLVGGAGNDTFILADDNELDMIWDFTSTGDQYDIIDISAFTGDDFDFNNLPDYFHIDNDYVYFDTTGTGTFTTNEAIARLGGGTTIDNDHIQVEIDGTRIGYDPDAQSVVYVDTADPAATTTGLNVAEVSGDDSGTVYEDAGSTLVKSGTLSVADGDTGEDAFIAETISGDYGSVTIGSNGYWVYSADNSQPSIQELSNSQTLNLNSDIDDYVRIESDLVPGDNFTISLWVKPEAVDVSVQGIFGSEPDGVSSRSPSLSLSDDGGLNWSSNSTDNVAYSGTVDNVFTQGEWSHVTWVKDGSEYRFYQDGNLVQTDTAPADVKLTGFTNLGRVDSSFEGQLDDLQTYDRALSPSEIADVINGDPQPGLFSHYDFAGDTISQALEDRAGNHPDGIANGSVDNTDLLDRPDTLTDTLTVRTLDGTTHDISITISGNNDAPKVDVDSDTVHLASENIGLTLTKADLLANISDTDTSNLSIYDIRMEVGNAIITDNHDGTWTLTPGADWSGNGIFSFSVSDGSSLIRTKADFTVNAVADTPVVTFAAGENPAFTIDEDNTVSISLSAEFSDLDGSETHSVVLSGIPSGATLSDGTKSVVVADDGSVDISDWNLSSLSVQPPENSHDDFTLALTATATEASGDETTFTKTIPVTVNSVNDLPEITITARAAETPVQLGTTTAGDQKDVELALRPNGGYIAVWTDKSQGSEGQIIGRLFNKDGVAESAEFRIDAKSVQTGSANVSVHDDGSFVVVWEDTNAEGRGQIEVQRFDASGNPLSSNTTVMTGNLHNPDVVVLDNGDYVVSAYDSWHGMRTEIQVFDSSGTAKTGVISTGSVGSSDSVDSVLSALSDGNWANVFRNQHTDEVKLSIFDDTGVLVETTSFSASESGIGVTSLPEGGIVVVYRDDGALKLRQFDNDGKAVEGEVDLGQTSEGEVSVTALADGTLFVSWNEADGLYGQRFLTDGTESGGKTTLTEDAAASQVSVIELENGSLQLGWHGADVDGDGYAVLGSNLILPVDDLVNGTVIATVTATDGDLDDNLTFSLTNDAGGRYAIDSNTGEITVADSSLIVAPSHTLTVAVTDGKATVTTDYTVHNSNKNLAPETADSSITAREDITYTFSESDFPIIDPNVSDSISEIQIESLPDDGSLILNGSALSTGATVSVSDIQAGNLKYLAEADDNGSAYSSFTFNVADRLGLYSTEAKTMTIDVTAENDAPIVVNAISDQSVAEDAALSYKVPVNTFTDIDGDSLTYSASMADGSALPEWLSFNSRSLKFSGTPDNEDVGTLSLKVTAADDSGATADAMFNLEITNINDGPIQVFQESGGLVSIEAEHFHSNVSRSGASWETQSHSNASGGEVVKTPSFSGFHHGSRVVGKSPELTYEIEFDSPGTYYVWIKGEKETTGRDSVHIGLNGEYQETNRGFTGFSNNLVWKNSGHMSVEVESAGRQQFNIWMRESGVSVDKIVLTKDPDFTPSGVGPAESEYYNAPADQIATDETAFSYTIAADAFVDTDVGDSLTLSATLSDGSPLPEWLSFDAGTRTFSGTPDDADLGNIVVKVTASDGESTRSAEFNLTVNNSNDTPDSVALDSTSVYENSAGAIVGTLTTTDEDIGDSHTYSVSDNRFEVVGGQLKLKDNISLDMESEGFINITVTSTDSSGASVNQVFTLTVLDDAPVSADATLTSAEDGIITLSVSDFAFNPVDSNDSLSTVIIKTLPIAGSLTLNGVVVTADQSVSKADIEAGLLTFSPAANTNGDNYASFTFKVSDGQEESVTANTITINVTPGADAPVSADGNLWLKQADSYSFSSNDFSFTDADSGDSLQSITITSLPSSGSLTLNGSAVTSNQVVTVADIANLEYTAPVTGPDMGTSFGFTVSDGSLSSDPQTFNLNVRGTDSDNLLTNGSAVDGTTGWDIIENNGAGWAVKGSGHDGDGFRWATSYGWGKKSQTVDLLAKGFTAEALDAAPDISVSDWYINYNHTDDIYYLKVELRDADNNVIESFDTGTLTATNGWSEAANVFSDYGPGVRYVYFEHGGKDSEVWGGHYGTRIDNAEIVIKVGDVDLVGTSADEILDGTDSG